MDEQQSAELIAQRQIAAAIVAQQAAASSSNTASLPQYHVAPAIPAPGAGGSKYQHLLAFIEELGKDTRPTYNGNRNCQERLKRGIGQARLMVRECMAELELAAKKQGGGQ